MSDSWLDSGHGDGRSLAPVTSLNTPEHGLTDGPRSGVWRSRSGRAFVAVVVVAAVIGSAGTAYAIRETLFPNIGPPTSRSVWQNPVPVGEPAPVAVPSTTSTTSTTILATSTTSTTTPPRSTPSSDDSNASLSGVPTTTITDDSGGSRSVSDDSGNDSGGGSRDGSGHGLDDSGSGIDNSGSGSGSDDSTEPDRSGSDDSVDELED